jgi:hypothetical protein
MAYAYGRYVDAAGDRSQVRPELCCFRIHWWPWRSWQAGVFLYRSLPRWRNPMVLVLVLCCIVAAQQWDRRNLWTRYVESAESTEDRFGASSSPGPRSTGWTNCWHPG